MKNYKTTKRYILELAGDPTLAVVSRQMAANALSLTKSTIDRQINDGSLESIKIEKTVCVLSGALIGRLESDISQVATVKAYLIEVALKGQTTTYEPVMATIGLPTRSPPNRARIGAILGEISEESFLKHGFLLSALVFNKALGRPSDSFYGLADWLGCEVGDDFLEIQLDKIWKHYT